MRYFVTVHVIQLRVQELNINRGVAFDRLNLYDFSKRLHLVLQVSLTLDSHILADEKV